MMTAEQWYEYQEKNQQYEHETQREMRKTASVQKQEVVFTGKDKKTMLLLVLFLGALFIGVVLSTSYIAEIKYDINMSMKEKTAIQNEIDTLNVKIKQGTSLKTIESRAVNELGMTNASPSQCVFLTDMAPVENYAELMTRKSMGS